ncbi:macro domain-containing protein [Costertonia aggregata]|uniref:Macro domain-containing protein n=1 Tax=Costertonia aggregata TaxID=343403 RepID=A0A7H9ARG2_9FLAO|nr:macro domain-containing protein [Costertonia aggregata]QLG46006.1 macro domain-containing protein [Costertonia aggregata]
MNHVKIFDKSKDITERNVDIIVAPVNRDLETSGVHKPLDYVIYNHRYQLRMERSIIPDKSAVAYGDVYVIPEEDGGQSSLMYAVLESSKKDNNKKRLEQFYNNIFLKAIDFGASSIRVPSLSHGIFLYPVQEVVHIGIDIAASFETFQEIQFYCYNDAYYNVFITYLEILKDKWKK